MKKLVKLVNVQLFFLKKITWDLSSLSNSLVDPCSATCIRPSVATWPYFQNLVSITEKKIVWNLIFDHCCVPVINRVASSDYITEFRDPIVGWKIFWMSIAWPKSFKCKLRSNKYIFLAEPIWNSCSLFYLIFGFGASTTDYWYTKFVIKILLFFTKFFCQRPVIHVPNVSMFNHCCFKCNTATSRLRSSP